MSRSDCWAVGCYYNGSNYQTLIEHYDGGTWSIVSSPSAVGPNSTAESNQLQAVTCNGLSDCWAVGFVTAAAGPFVGVGQPLIVHYDGTSWSLVSSPTVASEAAGFQAVTCVSSSDCWAAGYTLNGLTYQTLIEHYDGSTWSIAVSPNSINQENLLYGVTCSDAMECWAVGYSYTQDKQPYQTLIERYEGTSWSIVTSPNASTLEGDFLQAATCSGPNDCWAVGYYVNDANTNVFSLTEHYDGTAWTLVDTPNPSNRFTSDFQAMSCLSAGNCWAIGYSFDNTSFIQYTLIEQYTVPVPLNVVLSRMSHGNVGTFDVDLMNGNGVECRSGGAEGHYTMVFGFANPLTNVVSASVTSGNGTVASANIDSGDARNYIVTLNGVSNAQVVTVTVNNVADSAGNFSDAVPGTIKVLIGDTNGDGFVNSADISQTKSQSGNAVTSNNFREDLNADGFINSADISLVKSRSGTALP